MVSNELGIVLLVFASVTMAVFAVSGLVNLLRGRGLGPELERRLRDLERPRDDGPSRVSIMRDAMRSEIPALDRLLRNIKFADRVERLLVQAGSTLATSEFFLVTAVVGLAVFLVLRLLIVIPWPVAVVAALAGASLVPFWITHQRARRYRLIREQLPEALDLMASSLRAGHAYTAAVQVVAEELEEPIAAEFQVMVDQYRVGLGQRECMTALVERVDMPDLRLFSTAVLIQLETGGNLAEVLERLAEVIRARFRLAGQVRAITAEGRLSGAILGALPIAVGVIITLLNAEYLKPLFKEPFGLLMIGAAILLELIGFIWIRRIVEVRT
jgi:tight adherence protein B